MNSEGILSHKQHLNLSHYAYDVAENDMYAFQVQSLSGFLNLVFQNYYEFAEASISRTLDKKRRQLDEQLFQVGEYEHKEIILDTLLRQEQNRLLEQVQNYPKGYGFKFYLNTENAEFLMDEFKLESQWYHAHPMKYFKAVIEEYATKNRLQREKIVFSHRIEELQRYIEQGTLVCIDTVDGHRYEVKPYRILADHDSLYHYLVGISRPAGSGSEDDKIASFRISRFVKMRSRPKSYRSGKITGQELRQIQEKIGQDGVPFLISQSEDIVVRLTRTGAQRFKTQPHLRPKLISSEETQQGLICRFNCTEFQIRSYFFQFGPEVEILAPESLREHFKTHYGRAFHLYDDSEKK